MAVDPARPARFVRRDNRFVVVAELDDGCQVRAYLPNTARLGDVLVPGAALLVVPSDRSTRRTEATVTRVWDGTWVALEAAGATDLVVAHVRRTGELAGVGTIADVQREVQHARHRFDLRLTRRDGTAVLTEVKSLSRAVGRDAPLSATPSTRGVAHLAALAALARREVAVAVVFVVQRGDVDRLVVGPHADPAWVDAVRDARTAGVTVVAYACTVGPSDAHLDRELPVVDT